MKSGSYNPTKIELNKIWSYNHIRKQLYDRFNVTINRNDYDLLSKLKTPGHYTIYFLGKQHGTSFHEVEGLCKSSVYLVTAGGILKTCLTYQMVKERYPKILEMIPQKISHKQARQNPPKKRRKSVAEKANRRKSEKAKANKAKYTVYDKHNDLVFEKEGYHCITQIYNETFPNQSHPTPNQMMATLRDMGYIIQVIRPEGEQINSI